MSYEGTTYRHTDIHTYIQTYIHIDRQTEPNYDIDIAKVLAVSIIKWGEKNQNALTGKLC